MTVSFGAQPILHIFGSGKDSNPFYLDHNMYLCYLDARFFDFIGVLVVEVSGCEFYTSAIGTLLRQIYVHLALWRVTQLHPR